MILRMDYRQYRTVRRLVHSCCNYDCGNCLLLDDGEECVCPQSIAYSLVCKWFRVAVLPLDASLCAALLQREEPQRVEPSQADVKKCVLCGSVYVPKSNRNKYCPACAMRMERINAAERKRKQRRKCHALERRSQ